MSLSVVYVADTGHVAGALARTGADTSPDVRSLVGAELPLRVSLGGGQIAVLPLRDRRLAVAAADDEPAVFGDPLAFGVEQSPGGKPKPALVRLAPWATALELTAGELTLTLPAKATRLTPVLALISDGRETHAVAGEIAVSGDKAQLQVALTPGTHGVLILVAGYAGRLEAVEVK